jgi:hypothetical protein
MRFYHSICSTGSNGWQVKLGDNSVRAEAAAVED